MAACVVSTLLVHDQTTDLDAFAQWRVRRRVRKIESCVGSVSGNPAYLRVVLLEDQSFVTVHRGEIGPTVQGRMREEVDLASARWIPNFARYEVSSRKRLGIADREGRVQDRTLDRAPDVNDAVAFDRSERARILQDKSQPLAA